MRFKTAKRYRGGRLRTKSQAFPLLEKKKLPPKITGGKISALRSPTTGGPLEPSMEYGKTILYDPYGGEFHEWTPEGEAGVVTPRYAEAHKEAVGIAQSYLQQAKQIVNSGGKASGSIEVLEKAYRLIDSAQRVEPWHQWPEARLDKSPFYRQLKEQSGMIGNALDSARGSSGSERQKWVDVGLQRVRAITGALT